MAGPTLGTAWIQVSPSMNTFTSEVNRALAGINATVAGNKVASQLSSKIGAALGKVAKTGVQALATGLTAGTAAAGTLAAGLLKAGGNYNILQQNSRAALTQILGSQKAVNEQMAKLDDLVSKSPFGKDVFIKGQQQLLAFGMAAEDVVPTLDAIQNAVAATGGSADQLGEITFVMAQIQSAGKITGEDLMQLGERGINAAELIGSQMGKTGAQIREEITAGTLDADTAIAALTAGMTAKFGGATGLIKQQFTGAMDRVKAAWRDTGSILAEPFISKNGGGQAVIWANLVADSMRSIQAHVTAAMGVVTRRVQPAFDTITNGLRKANVSIASFNMNDLLSQVGKLGDYTPLITGATTALTLLGTKPIPYLGALGRGFTPVLAGVAALVATSPELRQVAETLANGLKPVLPALAQAGKAAADLAVDLISQLTPGLTKAAEGFADLVSDLAPLVPAVVAAASALTPLVGGLADLVGWVARIPGPVLAGVAAIVALNKGLEGLGVAMKAAAGTKTLTSAWQAVSTAAANSGQNVGGLAKVFATMSVPASAATQAVRAFRQDAVQMGGLNTAKAGLSTLAGGFMSLLSPANLAMGALGLLATVVASVAQQEAEAKQRAQEYADTLDDLTGATTENTQKLLENKVAAAGVSDDLAKLGLTGKDVVDYFMGDAEAVEKFNAAVGPTADLVNGTQAAMAEAYQAGKSGQASNAALTESEKEKADAYRNVKGLLGDLTLMQVEGNQMNKEEANTHDLAAEAAKRQADALDQVTDAMSRQAAANGDLIQAHYRTQDAQDAVNQAIAEGARVAQDANGHYDVMAASSQAAVNPLMSMAEAINTEAEAMAKAGESQADIDEFMQASIGTFNQLAESLGVNSSQVEELAKDLGLIPDHTSKVIDFTANTGDVDAKVAVALDNIKENAHGIISIDANGDPALQKLGETLDTFNEQTGWMTVDANTDPAIAQQLLLLGKINEDTGVLTIDAADEDARDAINQLQQDASTAPTMPITADTETQALPAVAQLAAEVWGTTPSMGVLAHDAGARATGQGINDDIAGKTPSMGVGSHDAGAEAKGQEINDDIAGKTPSMGVGAHDAGAKAAGAATSAFIAGQTPNMGVLAHDQGAKAAGQGISNNIASKTPSMGVGAHDQGAKKTGNSLEQWISDRWGYINVSAKDSGATTKAGSIRDTISGMTAFIKVAASRFGFADGGILAHAYADGGINAARALALLKAPTVNYYATGESHTAQIAPAGAWRVWAEPETGGEAYIPLAASKRARSLRILEDVADIFDMAVVPKKTQAFADGSGPASQAARVGSQVTVNIDQINNPVGEPTAVSLERELQRVGGLVGGMV